MPATSMGEARLHDDGVAAPDTTGVSERVTGRRFAEALAVPPRALA